MAKVTLNHTGPLGLPGGLVLVPGVATDVEDWDKIKDHGVVKLWLAAEVLVVGGGKQKPDPKPEGEGNEGDKTSERDDLKKQAAELGIEYAKNIPTEKLKELIDAKLAE